MTARADIPEDWPESLRLIAQVIGAGHAIQLARKFGGTEIYVPATVKPSGKIAKTIGLAAALALTNEFGSGALLIPLGPTTLEASQRRRIWALIAEGQSSATIARIVGCHERTVRRVRRHDPRQMDLFQGENEQFTL